MIDVRHRGRAILVGYLLFCVLYLGSNRVHLREPQVLHASAVDRAIPFLPWTIAVYLSQFLILFFALWLQTDSRRLTRAFAAIAVATIVSCAVFVVWPTTVARPPVRSAAFDALWLFDVPTNCFPSLHTALAAIAAWFWPRRGRWLAAAWAIAIVVSTLTTKQHVAIDVAGGAAVAVVALASQRSTSRGSKPTWSSGGDDDDAPRSTEPSS
jgi:membrane-associated phospholipid phosphatase